MGISGSRESKADVGVRSEVSWIGPHHGLLDLHLDDVLIHVVTLVLAGDTVIDVLPQVMLTVCREEVRGVRSTSKGLLRVSPSWEH